MFACSNDSKVDNQPSEDDKYKRTHSAPPQQREEGEIATPFRLCNADGTPLEIQIIDSSSEEGPAEDSGEKELEPARGPVSAGSSGEKAETRAEDVLSVSVSWIEDSSEDETFSPFLSFIAIEELRKQYPPIDEHLINNRVAQLLATKERSAVEFSMIPKKKESLAQANEKLKALKEKKDTPLEKVRNEFNRVTDDNLGEVVENLLAIKVEKVDDMKEIAGFVFEKAITERVYLRIYTAIIGRLKKVWKTAEELAMTEKSQTCFFGVLLNYIVSKVTDKQKWSAQLDISGLRGTRQEIEQKIEDFEAERYKRKARAMGAIDLLLSLYLINIIGPSNLINTINLLVNGASSPEHVEMVAKILKTATEKLVTNGKEAVVLQMASYLKSNIGRHDGRIDFLIESTLEHAQRYIHLVKPGQDTNTFAALVNEGAEEEEEPPCEEDILYDYVTGLASRVKSGCDEMAAIRRDIERLLQTRSNELFFTLLFAEIVSNYKCGDTLRELFMVHLVHMPGNLKSCLRGLKDRLGMLAIDFPITTSKYSEFLCYLRGAELIDSQFFENLKTNEFAKKSEQLQQRWKNASDTRYGIVFQQ